MTRKEAAKNARKFVKKQKKKSDFSNLSDAWNMMHGLRAGDRIAGSNAEDKGLHPNAWSLGGMLRVGFRGVGRNAAGSSSAIGETSHNIDAVIATAHLLERAQADRFAELFSADVDLPGAAMGLCIIWHHDATPWLCKFGRMEEKVQDKAAFPETQTDTYRDLRFGKGEWMVRMGGWVDGRMDG